MVTVWPSGLRRLLQVQVFIGASSNLVAVISFLFCYQWHKVVILLHCYSVMSNDAFLLAFLCSSRQK